MAMSAAKTANKKPGTKAKKATKPRERTVHPDDIVEVPEDDAPEFEYVLKPKDPPPVDVAAALQVEDQVAEEASTRKGRDWYSGYCSTTKPGLPCPDGREINKAGEVIRRCLYVGENGAKVTPRHLYCACECHRDPERAGQAIDRDLGSAD